MAQRQEMMDLTPVHLKRISDDEAKSTLPKKPLSQVGHRTMVEEDCCSAVGRGTTIRFETNQKK
jgi:hypothetical protein